MADELVEVFHLIAKGNGVGRVLGVRHGGEASCEVVLLMIWRIGDDYRLRTTAVGLDALTSARGHLFKDPPPAALPCEDVEFSSLEAALTVAATLVQASREDPLPGHGAWLTRSEFLKSLAASAVRPEMTWLPQPPHWWNVTRKVLVGSGNVAVFAVPTGITWWVFDQFGVWDWDADLASVVAVALWMVLSWLLVLLSEPGERVLDAVERRIERHRDVPGPSASDAAAPHPVDERPVTALGSFDEPADASAAAVREGISAVHAHDAPVDPASHEVQDSPTAQGD